VPIEILCAKVSRVRGASLEAAARETRYRLLAASLREGEILLTAHHEDDQLETVVVAAVSWQRACWNCAMPALAPFAKGGWRGRCPLAR